MRHIFNPKPPFPPQSAPSCSSIHRIWCWRFPWVIHSNYLLRLRTVHPKIWTFFIPTLPPEDSNGLPKWIWNGMRCQVSYKTPSTHRLCKHLITSHFLVAVSSMLFDCGGLLFPGCAFSGWYMSTGRAFTLPTSSHGAWFPEKTHFLSLDHFKSNRNRVPKPLRHKSTKSLRGKLAFD